MRQVGLPRRIGLIFMVYKAPADRISVRGMGCLLFLPGGMRGQRRHRTGPWGYRRIRCLGIEGIGGLVLQAVVDDVLHGDGGASFLGIGGYGHAAFSAVDEF